MSHRDDDTLAKWLDAELNGAPDDPAADRLFASLASVHLTRFDAPAGLSARIVAALPAGAFLPARPAFDWAASRLVRLTLLAAVVLLGLALALVSPRQLLPLAADATALAARLLHDGLASLGAAVGVWKASLDLFAALGQAAAVTVTTGFMPLLVAANLAVATAAFVGLKRLLTPREECF